MYRNKLTKSPDFWFHLVDNEGRDKIVISCEKYLARSNLSLIPQNTLVNTIHKS